MKNQLITYVRAGYPALFVVTPEEQRAEAEIKAAAAELKDAKPLRQNAYKVQLARVAVRRAILKAGGAA